MWPPFCQRGTLPAQVPEMMKSLLEDRFKIKVHTEKKDFPIYDLEALKSGLKMSEARPDPELDNLKPGTPQGFTGAGSSQGISASLGQGSSFTFSNNKFEGKRLTMATLA